MIYFDFTIYLQINFHQSFEKHSILCFLDREGPLIKTFYISRKYKEWLFKIYVFSLCMCVISNNTFHSLSTMIFQLCILLLFIIIILFYYYFPLYISSFMYKISRKLLTFHYCYFNTFMCGIIREVMLCKKIILFHLKKWR